MQTFTIEVQNGFVQEFLKIIEPYKDKIQLKMDKNLELDPYFYERQKELCKIRDDIKNNNLEMLSHSAVWNNIKNHLKESNKH